MIIREDRVIRPAGERANLIRCAVSRAANSLALQLWRSLSRYVRQKDGQAYNQEELGVFQDSE